MSETDAALPRTTHELYERLHRACAEIMRESFAYDNEGAINKAHSFLADVQMWLDVLESRPERDVFAAAMREYQFSILALLQGQYRHAFAALRYFLEKSLAAIEFSAHELHLRLWRLGQRDIGWRAIISPDTGVLSAQFVGAFGDPLKSEAAQYRVLAERVYRECSEYVHGNAHTQDGLPEELAFDADMFDAWVARADSVRLVVSFALASRYVLGLSDTALRNLEPAITETLGHIAAIREILGGVTEEQHG